jgi:transcriptional regulator with XRE-family HTH domain
MEALTLSIGTRIKLARIARGIRQHDLSRESDVPQATISAIENDYRPPRHHELEAILGALRVTMADLAQVRA